MKSSNFKEWLWSAKVLTTIVWILFPLGYVTLTATPLSSLIIVQGTTWLGPVPLIEYSFGTSIFTILVPPIPLMIVLFLFSIFPAVYPTEKFFLKRGSINVVTEYRYIRKILFASFITLIISIITYYFLASLQDYLVFEQHFEIKEFPVIHLLYLRVTLNFVAFIIPAISIFILLKLLLEHARKQFRFYYAEACIEIVNKTGKEADKADYLYLCLDWYNKFVKRVTKSGIDIQLIYSKIISNSQLSNNILLDTIVESFHDADELNPMRHMLALLSSWKEGATLVKESVRTKIRESSDILIPIVTVIITILSTFFVTRPTTPGT